MCRQDARLGLIHKFLWDRYRSVRQDLYIQGMDVSCIAISVGAFCCKQQLVLPAWFTDGSQTLMPAHNTLRTRDSFSLQDEFSVNIFEEVVRFHLLSEHELCEEEASSEWPGVPATMHTFVCLALAEGILWCVQLPKWRVSILT